MRGRNGIFGDLRDLRRVSLIASRGFACKSDSIGGQSAIRVGEIRGWPCGRRCPADGDSQRPSPKDNALPSLEGRGRGWVGPIEPRRRAMRKPTHPQPLPSREGSKILRHHASYRAGACTFALGATPISASGSPEPATATLSESTMSARPSEGDSEGPSPAIKGDALPSLKGRGRGWVGPIEPRRRLCGNQPTPSPSLPGRGARYCGIMLATMREPVRSRSVPHPSPRAAHPRQPSPRCSK